MPVFNEEASIKPVVDAWVPVLRSTVIEGFQFLILDDGSSDNTLKILDSLKEIYPELQIIHHTNKGHGQTCLVGYKEAIKNNAEWIFQIDSDGQCDPIFFPIFWDSRNTAEAIYGYRIKRFDGLLRHFITKVVSFAIGLSVNVWIKDANVPYRLIKTRALEEFIDLIPTDFYLANIAVSVFLKMNYQIRWIRIHFLQRLDPARKSGSFLRPGLELVKQLRKLPMQKKIQI